MKSIAQSNIEAVEAPACFATGRRRLRVDVSTITGRTERFGASALAGICYVVVTDPDGWKPTLELTRREREIGLQIARGCGTKQSAHELDIRPHTAAMYINRIRAKLGVRDRLEMVAVPLRGRADFRR